MARTSRKQGKAAARFKPTAVEAGLYVRLSDEDNGGRSADGIDNQLEYLLEFVKQFEKMKVAETYMEM